MKYIFSFCFLFISFVSLEAYSSDTSSLKEAAEQGDPGAQHELGMAYLFGSKSIPKDPAQGIKWLNKAAKQGYAESQYWLGMVYLFGRKDIPKDPAQATKWLNKAVAQGHPGAQNELGMAYLFGSKGIPKDSAQGIKWLNKAAAQGHPLAPYVLGMEYFKGVEIPKNLTKAKKYFKIAADQGDAEAQNKLGMMFYESGNHPEAIKWFKEAVENDHFEARKNLTNLHFEGETNDLKDYVKFANLEKQFSLENPHPLEFEYRTGIRFHVGFKRPKDSAKAIEWLEQAAEGGHPLAQIEIDKLNARAVQAQSEFQKKIESVKSKSAPREKISACSKNFKK